MAVTDLNAQSLAVALIRSVFAETPTPEQDTSGDAIGTLDEETTNRVLNSLVTAASTPKKFSSDDPFAYQQAVQYVTKTFFGGKTGQTSLIGSFVNAWAERLGEKTVDDTGKVTDIRYPSFQDLVAQPDFQSGAAMLPFAGVIPEDAYVIDDTGTKVTHMTYSPMIGVQQEQIPYDPATLFGGQAPGQLDLRSPQDSLPPGLLERLDPQTQAALTGQVIMTNAKGQQVTVGHPLMTMQDYLNILQPEQPTTTGGGTAAKIDFDRRKLTEAARQAWHAWLFAEPSQQDLNKIVDGYISEATGFWRRGGGTLDYTAFLQEKLRQQPRYQTIFRYKPPDVPEDEFISTFARPVAGIGLRPDLQEQETVKSITSGGSPLGQIRRISGTREGMQATNFSRRFAATLQGLGQGART